MTVTSHITDMSGERSSLGQRQKPMTIGSSRSSFRVQTSTISSHLHLCMKSRKEPCVCRYHKRRLSYPASACCRSITSYIISHRCMSIMNLLIKANDWSVRRNPRKSPSALLTFVRLNPIDLKARLQTHYNCRLLPLYTYYSPTSL